MSVHSGQDTSTFVNVSETGHRKSLKTSRTQTAEESQGEDNYIVGRDSTSLKPLRLLSGFGQRSFTFSASAQVSTWGASGSNVRVPLRDDLYVTPTPSPYHYGRPVLSPVIQLLTRTIHSSVTWFRETPNLSQSLSASEKFRPNRGRSVPRQTYITPRRCVSSIPQQSIQTQSHPSARSRVNMCHSILESSSFVKIPLPGQVNACLRPPVRENSTLMTIQEMQRTGTVFHKVDNMESGRRSAIEGERNYLVQMGGYPGCG